MDQKTMLFGRNQTISGLILLAFFCTPIGIEASQESAKKDGTKFGKTAHSKNKKFWGAVLVDELTPPDQKGKVFDSKEATKRMKTEDLPNNEIYEFLKKPELRKYEEMQPDEESIKHSDKLLDQYEKGYIQQPGSEGKYKTEKCLQRDAPFEIEIKYTRKVNVKHIPEVKKSVHICKGHEEEIYCDHDSRHRTVRKEIEKFAGDLTVKSYHVEKISGHPLVISHWTHHDDVACCDNYQIEERVVSKKRTEIEDIWAADHLKKDMMANSPICTFIKSEQTGSGVKKINGLEISRDSWEKIDTYKCRYEQIKCPFLGSYLCTEKDKKCKEKSGSQCALWEISFKCLAKNRTKNQLQTEEIFGTDDNLWETDYEPNTSFVEVTTKLKIFDEMKRQFENSLSPDVTKIQIFGGKKSQCSKSVAKDLMYDCCFSFHGLANELKLSKCTSDEIALAEMREKGLCHYLGSYKVKALNKLWTSRKEHVYCCFPTKLARVLQEEGRKQLGIEWGKPKKPNCRGFTQDEIQRLDLSKIDLSEAYDPPPSVDMTDKIQKIQDKVERRLKEQEAHK